jgi:hypothetical protein
MLVSLGIIVVIVLISVCAVSQQTAEVIQVSSLFTLGDDYFGVCRRRPVGSPAQDPTVALSA